MTESMQEQALRGLDIVDDLATITQAEWEAHKGNVTEILSIMREVQTVVKQGQSMLENGGIAGLLSGGSGGPVNPLSLITGALTKRR